MKYQFTYYLHDDYSGDERFEWLALQQGLPQEIAREIADSRPFYEIGLECEYDTASGITKVLNAG